MEDCLDLSTGISPWAWPVPEVPQKVWQRLPGQYESPEQLAQAAADYYGCSTANVLAVPGSQWAIQSAPEILQPISTDVVLLPELGYEEHRYAWGQTEAQLQFYSGLQSLQTSLQNPRVRFVVVINPNNPTGELIDQDRLVLISEILAERGGCLILDEAFVDAYPAESLANFSGRPGLLIFRSLGKFFGLPGLRLGFVLGAPDILQQLNNIAGPWNTNSAAEWLGAKMLLDTNWVAEQRSRLQMESVQMLHSLRSKLPEFKWVSAGLFISALGAGEKIELLREALALEAILVRVFRVSEKESLIRIGLAGADSRKRLLSALGESGAEAWKQQGIDKIQQISPEMSFAKVKAL